MINGVLLSKLNLLDELLNELKSLGPLPAQELERDWRTRRAVERNLQILIEIVVDVCQRIIALAGQSPAATSGEAVQRCVQLGVLASEEPFRRMIQFRNFIVRRYEKVDVTILAEILHRRLDGFESFRRQVMDYAAR